jgi:predicted outer membrane repeat protein
MAAAIWTATTTPINRIWESCSLTTAAQCDLLLGVLPMRTHSILPSLSLLLLPFAAAAETLHVPSDYATIQAAIDAAVAGDVVEIADGTYTGAGNKDLDFAGRAITVRGASGDPALCIIDCENDGRGFIFQSGEGPDSIVEGLTIRHGLAVEGGAIYCHADGPVIRNCELTDNGSTGDGGAVYVYYMDMLTLDTCWIVGNTAGASGGGVCSFLGAVTLLDCTIRDNDSAEAGGGVYNFAWESAVLRGCTITGNVAQWSAGGVAVQSSGTVTIDDCVISDNVAGWAGGVDLIGSDATLSNCTIADNRATAGSGGGLDLGRGSPTLRNCSITGNLAAGVGGGIDLGDGAPRLIECTISGNTALFGGGVSSYRDAEPIFIGCTISGNRAIDAGGAIRYAGSTGGVHANCTITDNTAIDGAGVYYDRDNGDHSFVNCTISGNKALRDGGGLYCTDGVSLEVRNCVLWANIPEQVFLDVGDVECQFCDIQGGWAGAGNIDAEPFFVDPDGPDDDPATWEDNDYRLSPGSPCIDAADNTAVPADVFDLDGDGDVTEPIPFDLDGSPRFVNDPDTADTGNPGAPGPLVDMGAYEFQVDLICPGDVDGDGDTDQSDLGILLVSYEKPPGDPLFDPRADLSGDGVVGQPDLGILLANYACGL